MKLRQEILKPCISESLSISRSLKINLVLKNVAKILKEMILQKTWNRDRLIRRIIENYLKYFHLKIYCMRQSHRHLLKVKEQQLNGQKN